jgi:hypothetical protein
MCRPEKLAIAMVLLWLEAAAGPVFAQALTVQQPAVGVFGANTVVSAPVGESFFVGGFSAAATSRTRSGPIPNGPIFGLSREAAGMSTQVQILDLRAADRALIESITRRPAAHPSSPLNASAEQAWQTLSRRSRPQALPTTMRAAEPEFHDAEHYERLAQEAERSGRPGLARLHWRMAAKHGSAQAAERLQTVAPAASPGFPVESAPPTALAGDKAGILLRSRRETP